MVLTRDGTPRQGFLHDVLDPLGFTLLVYAPAITGAERTALRRWAWQTPVAVAVAEFGSPGAVVADDGALSALLRADRWPLALIRPDEHVAARLESCDLSALDRALSRAMGGTVAAHAGAEA